MLGNLVGNLLLNGRNKGVKAGVREESAEVETRAIVGKIWRCKRERKLESGLDLRVFASKEPGKEADFAPSPFAGAGGGGRARAAGGRPKMHCARAAKDL